jgi:hypothetical protein
MTLSLGIDGFHRIEPLPIEIAEWLKADAAHHLLTVFRIGNNFCQSL